MKTSVLVVDDNESLRLALCRILESYDYATTTVDSLSAAKHVLDVAPDVVLLDLMLGGESGEDVLQHIRDNDLGCRVIVMTATDRGSPRLAALAALRPDAVLHKPMDLADLLAAIGPAARAART